MSVDFEYEIYTVIRHRYLNLIALLKPCYVAPHLRKEESSGHISVLIQLINYIPGLHAGIVLIFIVWRHGATLRIKISNFDSNFTRVTDDLQK